MNTCKNIEELLDAITKAAIDYQHENDDKDFVADVRIIVEDGWAKATLIEKGGEK